MSEKKYDFVAKQYVHLVYSTVRRVLSSKPRQAVSTLSRFNFFSSLNYTLYIIEIFLQRRVLSLFRACLRKICRVDMLKHSSSSYLITIINYFLYTSLRFPRLPLFVSFFFLFLFLYFLASPADPMIINSSPFIPIYAHFTHSRTIISVPSSNIIIIISLRL